MTYHTTDSDDDGIVDADVDATSVSSSSFNLPSGYTIDEDGSNNLVIRDTSGTIVLAWDDTNSKWTTANLDADTFNGADIANAVSGEFPKAQGDGTLTMQTPSGGSLVGSGSEVSGSRSMDTTYTNNTGGPLVVFVGITGEAIFKYNGIRVQDHGQDSPIEIGAVIPDGDTYRFDEIGSLANIVGWVEVELSVS